MKEQKSVAQNVSLNGGIYKWICTVKNTSRFHGNLSKAVNTILEEARRQNITITFEDGKQYTLQELEDKVNNTYYEFYDIKVSFKKITNKFKIAFNAIPNNELKAALYNYIRALTIYLNKVKENYIKGPALSSSSNLAIYQDGYLMLYVDVNHIQNDKVHVSRLLQFNQQRFQPEDAIVWKEIVACLGQDYVNDVWLTEDDLNKLTEHFLSL